MRTIRLLLLGLVATSGLAACGERRPCPSEDSDEGLYARLDVALDICNRPPTIKVDGSRQASKGAIVELDAAPSRDPNGDTLRYTWSFKSKPATSTTQMMGADGRTVRFLVDQVGSYVVLLAVTDGELTVTSEPIIVTARNDAPVAVAGGDVTVDRGVSVTLDGSGSSDVNGDALSYAWSFTQVPAGSLITFAPSDVASPTFTPDARGPYEVVLTVSDGELTATDTLTVFAGISANVPVAVAATLTPTIAVDGLVRLDGTGSRDADGDPLGYRWTMVSRPDMSLAAISGTGVASPTFTADQPGEYRIELVVDDGYHLSAPSVLFVTAFGDPRIRCLNTVPFTNGATVTGDTSGRGNDYETGCGPAGANDVVLEFVAPVDYDDLTIDLGAAFPAVMGVYIDDCGPAARRACATGMQASASIGRVSAGDRVAIIVDGSSAAAQGAFTVAISGLIASAQPCRPGDTSFTCDLGVCGPTPTGPRCPAILDCPDGVDVDRDGRTDEDVCSSPPVLTCPPDQVVDVLATSMISATRTSTSPIVRRRWTVEEEPLGSSLAPTPRDQPDTRVRPLLYGDYRLRYTEIDDDLESSSCETVLSAGTRDALRVELIWNPTIPEELHSSDVDLHLLHPDATVWWGALDCHYANGGPDWDAPGVTEDNPRLDLDDTNGRGPENINVLAPPPGQTYRIGAHYFSDHGYGPATVYVNVFCHSRLAQRFGPVTMANDLFWKIADVRVDAASCLVTPLGSPGAPIIVSEADSRAAR